MDNKAKQVDVSQIAFITNRKTLIAACDYLQAPDLNGDPDKCPASLHARYSRIKLVLTDFEKEPSVVLSYNLDPSEIRLLYQKICMLTMTDGLMVVHNQGFFFLWLQSYGSDQDHQAAKAQRPEGQLPLDHFDYSRGVCQWKVSAGKERQKISLG